MTSDDSMSEFLEYQDQTLHYYIDLMGKLERMNSSLGFVLHFLDETQGRIEARLRAIQSYLGWAGELRTALRLDLASLLLLSASPFICLSRFKHHRHVDVYRAYQLFCTVCRGPVIPAVSTFLPCHAAAHRALECRGGGQPAAGAGSGESQLADRHAFARYERKAECKNLNGIDWLSCPRPPPPQDTGL